MPLMASELCSKCGSSIVEVEALPPHYAKRECIGVDHHFHGWVSKPWTLERAQLFLMPFGKHTGLTVAEILAADRSYLEWMARTLAGNAGKAARTILEGMP
jgi:hypothetical protein